MNPRRLLRFLVVAALAGFVVIAAAAPAWAHATVQNTDPADGSQVAQSPPQVTMVFSENVEIQLGAIRLFDCSGKRIETGAPHHGAHDDTVLVSIPKLASGTYLVAWRVISADSHPVHGGFQFSVGQGTSQANCAAAATGKSSKTVGILFGAARVALFAGLALLIGGGVFLVLIARGTSAAPGTRVIAWIGWAITLVATVSGIMLQGPYGEGTGLGDAFKTSVIRDILHTHYGAVAEFRLVLLVLAIPALLFLRRADTRQPPLPAWGLVGCSALAVALAATPGLAGHADTGSETFFAVPLDTLHVLAMSVWLGGLVALVAGALGGAFSGSLRRAIVQFSQLALGSVVVLVVSGIFASWRQVGFTIRGYTDTSYGNILLVKIGIVAALIGVAAVSRSIVRKRESAPLGAPDTVIAAVDERTVSGLRRSVGVEVALGIAVLIVTAMLVNAQPAPRSALAPKLFATDVNAGTGSSSMVISVIVDPTKAGPNTMHIYTLLPNGRPFPVTNISATVALPAQGIDPVAVKLEKGGPNHWLANGVLISPSGKWTLQIHVTRGQFTDVPAPPIEVPIR